MIEQLARLGYASKAFVYAVIGTLAASAALNLGGRVTDTSGALRVILHHPSGSIILVVLGAGLSGYALWRVLDALFDPDRHGNGAKGLVVRVGSVVRALIYGALGLEAWRLARGLRGSDGGETQMWTARVMDLPFGAWLVGLVGLIVVVYGLSEIASSFSNKVDASIDTSSIPRSVRGTVLKVCRFGVGARATILVVLGIFLVRAGIYRDPGEAHGTRESIVELAGAFEGRWLLIAIALGLLAYALDQALHARCRRIRSLI